MSKVPKLRILVTLLLLVSLLPLAVVMAPLGYANTDWPCAYTGYAFVDEAPVPAGTGIRVLEDSTVLAETTTGLWLLDDNQYYVDVMAEVGTEVNFQIWDGGAWAPAVETAIHVMYGRVEVDLHTGVPTMHIDAQPFLFVYPWSDCDLPDALSNIGPAGLDLVITVWSTEGGTWMSYDAATGAGFLGPYGLDEGQAYVMTHDGGVCTDWEMCY